MNNETRIALSENFFCDISLSFFRIFKYVWGWLDSFRVTESNIFTIGEKVKSYGDMKVVNRHIFRELVVPSHGLAHSQFSILVAFHQLDALVNF